MLTETLPKTDVSELEEVLDRELYCEAEVCSQTPRGVAKWQAYCITHNVDVGKLCDPCVDHDISVIRLVPFDKVWCKVNAESNESCGYVKDVLKFRPI